jgi:hypothetical protein
MPFFTDILSSVKFQKNLKQKAATWWVSPLPAIPLKQPSQATSNQQISTRMSSTTTTTSSAASSASSSVASDQTWIPSIAGWEKCSWKHFTEDCVYDASGNLVSGSFGVHFDTKENMSAVFTRFEGDQNAICDYLTKTRAPDYHRVSKGKQPAHLHPTRALQLVKFYEFASNPKQNLFYLRRAAETLCLCRKTSGYSYEPERFTATKGTQAVHRISFEVVKSISAEDSLFLSKNVKRLDTGKVCSIVAIPFTIYTAPLLPPAQTVPTVPPAVLELEAVVARITALRTELDSLTSSLSTIISTLRV